MDWLDFLAVQGTLHYYPANRFISTIFLDSIFMLIYDRNRQNFTNLAQNVQILSYNTIKINEIFMLLILRIYFTFFVLFEIHIYYILYL